MKPKYTDEQIEQTILEMPMMKCQEYAPQWELDMFKQFLDHLPVPHDDLHVGDIEVIDIEDVLEGDRVLVRTKNNSLYQVYVKTNHDHAMSWVEGMLTYNEIKRVYLVDRPIQHPDPAEHPVIIVNESTVLPTGSEPQKVIFVRPYYRNDIWAAEPETITKWEPADIVPKVVETND